MKAHPVRSKIIAYLKENPEASIREIKTAVGISSTSVVDYHITKLAAAGVLKKINRYEVGEGV